MHPTAHLTIKTLLAAAGLRRLHLHDLRGSWITLSLQAGVAPYLVTQIAGHSSQNVTRQSYIHVTQEAGREAAERWWRYLHPAAED